jgi:MYXO-CTERM domain-containing protein
MPLARWMLPAVGATLSFAATLQAGEAGLVGRTDIYLEDGFETSNWYEAWGRSSPPMNTSVVSDGTSYRGASHLRVAVPAGGHYGTSFGFDFAKQIGSEPDEAHFRYAIRLGPTWTTEGGGGGKLPGFGGTYGIAGWGGKPSNGTNGWSARGLFWNPLTNAASGDTRLGFYVYHADMTGQYGSNWFWSGSTLGPDGVLQRGQWYELEVYVKLNTPAQNDGILRAWADGEPVYEKSDIRFRDVETLKLERVWFDIYYGGSWSAPADMYIDFDNVVIAENRIGVVSDSPGSAGAAGAAGSSGGGGGGTSAAGGNAGSATGGASGSGAATAAAGAGAAAASDEGLDGGCGCRVSGERGHWAWLFLALSLSVLGRRRRAS